MPILTLPSAVVSFTEMGHGTPILLLHANPGDSRDYDAVMEPLSRLGRVVALDWPGYGQSPPLPNVNRTTVDDLYHILEEFVATLGLRGAVVIGCSVGGNVAVQLAARHPQRIKGLILVSPGGFTPAGLARDLFCRWQGSRLSMSPRRFAGLYLQRKNEYTRAMLTRAGKEQARPEALALNRALWRSFGGAENDVREIADQVQAPVLLIFGKYDPVIRYKQDGREALQALPQSKREVLPCGHAPFAELPDEFLRKVEHFVRGLSRTSPIASGGVTMDMVD